jgi:uncharacterized peroxidase-related enzyme
VESHTEFLRRVSLDEELAAALRRDHREVQLSEADGAMLDFTVRLTEAAYKLTPDDLNLLRAAGFDDRAILQITLIGAWFNYINRVADALGVGRPDPPSGR